MAEGPFGEIHILYTFGGALPSGEVWTAGIRTGVATDLTLVNVQDLAAIADSNFRTFFNASNSLATNNPDTVTYTGVTARQVALDGTTLLLAEHSPAATAGSAATQGAPNQTALVVSLLTLRPGKRGRGRMYMPYLTPTFTVGQDTVPTFNISQLATAFAAFCTNYNAATLGSGAPVPALYVQSRATPPGGNRITSIEVGNVVDTQRRRRNKVREVYSSAVVV